ncbi:nucleoside deaminase [Sphingomonas sp.]|uniref:nucleoside deaminase n=1 Tax=Sphingomonas sp. TaxID=28214 RepID=UPI001AFD722D|nr:nucleoside deaminase [Sphingomonas sp.]MBO9711986.1 nucleoside deaminase [Sphingomonas sp.]
MNDIDARFVTRAYELALESFEEGGCPIGSVIARGDTMLGEGHNQRVQQGDPIAHGEMDALRNAGRQKSYAGTTLYTSLSPCMMCAGTIVQFKIPRVVIAENTSFGGNEAFLRDHGVEVVILGDARCIELMRRFVAERPELWNEDIAED